LPFFCLADKSYFVNDNDALPENDECLLKQPMDKLHMK